MQTQEIPEFGIKRENEERRDGGGGIVFDPETQKYAVAKQLSDGLFRTFAGGIDPDEDIKEGSLREVTEESGLNDFLYVEEVAVAMAHYRNPLRNVNRVTKATCFLIILNSKRLINTELENHEKFSLVWATAEEIFKNWQERNENNDHDHSIYFLKKALAKAVELGYDKTSKI